MEDKKHKIIILVNAGKTAADILREIELAKKWGHEAVVYIEEECQDLDTSVRELIAPFMMEMRDMMDMSALDIEEPDPDPNRQFKSGKDYFKHNMKKNQGKPNIPKQNFNVRGQGRRR